MQPLGKLAISFVLFLAVTADLPGQAPDADDEPEFVPGLAAELKAGGQSSHRIDEDLSFDWDTRSPDPRIGTAAFEARWTGRLLVRRADTYWFSVRVRGRVSISLAGRTILRAAGQEANPVWVRSSAVELPFGFHPLEVTYERTGAAGQLEWFWEAKHFERERVPSGVLFHAPASEDPSDLGERLVRALRCAACHELPAGGRGLRAPSLTRLRGAVSPAWLVGYLQQPAKHKSGVRMPDMGLSAAEAEAVAAFLLSVSESPGLESSSAGGQSSNGRQLIERLGCLACHRIGTRGTDALFGGGDLSLVAAKRPAGFFARWLEQPASLNADHRMPVFPLEKKEVADLAAFLATLGNSSAPATPLPAAANLIRRGRALVESRRCANCHQIPGVAPTTALAWHVTPPNQPVDQTCLGSPGAGGKHPGYRLEARQQQAVQAFLRALPGPTAAPLSLPVAAGQLLEANNCLLCHARGNAAGLRPWVAQMGIKDPKVQAALLPPSLHGVGDKLDRTWLAEAIAGRAPRLRPWLAPRMPRFPLAPSEIDTLTSYLIAHDAMPANEARRHGKARPEEQLVAAHSLLGSQGFGCVSCHAIGNVPPSEQSAGARGPDLRFLGQRIRQSWFDRFLREPARLSPGIEMPAIQQAVPGFQQGSLEEQRAALWYGLNAPGLDPPTAAAVQVLAVMPGERPVILRDLFEHGPGLATVRPFAIGLPNGHNLLLDLDRLGIRRWWVGDFARQRVRGKKWYWETAGITLLDFPEAPSLLASPTPPLESGRTMGWLERVEHDGDRVRFQFRSHGSAAPVQATVTAGQNGWQLELRGPGLRSHPLGNSAVFSTPLGPAQLVERELPDGGREFRFSCSVAPPARQAAAERPAPPSRRLPCLDGYEVLRLPLSDGPMPTALAWQQDGTLLVSSLKGGVYRVLDRDSDGLPDHYQLFSDHLSAPFGLRVEGDDVLVSHRQELLRLKAKPGATRADRAEVVATGWGVSTDYHDWAVGPVRDASGKYYLLLSAQEDQRPAAATLGRGQALQIHSDGRFTTFASGLRYAMGLAMNADGDLFATDNQGVTNPFNELNHLRLGHHYGFLSKYESPTAVPPATQPAIQIPHPWTRSVNGIAFVPTDGRFGPFAGQLIGADFTTRKLIRLSLQRVGATFQGAAYPFSRDDPALPAKDETFLGPLAVAFGPDHCLYVGSLLDSGWGGGNNRGAIERVRFVGPVPFGIREVRANPEGFTLDFTDAVDAVRATRPEAYSITCYRRVHHGGYETPDQDLTRVQVDRVTVAPDRRSVTLRVHPLRPTFVYEIGISATLGGGRIPWPAVAYYTLNAVPRK